MVIFGLAAGIATNSALSLMLDLTLPEVAGTFVGVWGLAQALSRAMGKLVGGGLLDLGRFLTGMDNNLMAYTFVFLLEIIVMLAAIIVLRLVNVNQFKNDTSNSMEKILLSEMD